MLSEDHDKTRRVAFVTRKRFAVLFLPSCCVPKEAARGRGKGDMGSAQPLKGFYFLKEVFVVENDM